MAVIEVYVNSFLIMDQGIESPDKGASASSFLNLSQEARQPKQFISTSNALNLGHVITLRRSITNVSTSNFLPLTDHGAKTIFVSVLQTFYPYHEAKSVEYEHVQQTLALSQSAIASAAKNGTNTLVLTQSAIYNVTRNLAITQTLALTSNGNAFLLDDNYYSLPTPALGSPTFITLTFGSTSITLRNPTFNDVDRLEHTRIKRKSRGGDLIIAKRNQWPKTSMLSLAFQALSKTQADNLRAFIKASLGKDITLVDHEGRTRTGFLIAPLASITENGPSCNISARFDFQQV